MVPGVISRRHHRIALVAVFVLALAAGFALAVVGLPQRIADVAASGADTGETARLSAERDALAAQLHASDEFAGRVGPDLVRGKLTGVPVTVVSLGADPADTRAVAELVVTAGGSVAGRSCSPRPSPTRPAPTSCATCSARLLPSGAQLPTATDAGALAGGLLGSALLTPPDGPAPAPDAAGTVLAGLAGGGFAEAPQGSPRPGDSPSS